MGPPIPPQTNSQLRPSTDLQISRWFPSTAGCVVAASLGHLFVAPETTRWETKAKGTKGNFIDGMHMPTKNAGGEMCL